MPFCKAYICYIAFDSNSNLDEFGLAAFHLASGVVSNLGINDDVFSGCVTGPIQANCNFYVTRGTP